MTYRKFTVWTLALFMVLAFAIPVQAERFQELDVSILKVTKELRVNGLIQAAANTSGNVWYVDSGKGIDGLGAPGSSSELPFDSVDYAIGRATANNGDFIIVMPGHTETFTAADGFDADVAGITILGLGDGADMPTFNFTDTDATVAIGAANVTIANVRFVAGVHAIVIGVAVEKAGDNFTMIDCVFPEPVTNTFDFIDGIDLADATGGPSGTRLLYNEYYHTGAIGPAHFLEAGNSVNSGLQIIGNVIMGEFSVAAIWSDTADLRVLIKDNVIMNMTTGQHAIEFTGNATGWVTNNTLYGDTEQYILDPGIMYMADNKISTAINLDAIPRWVVDNGLNHLVGASGQPFIVKKALVSSTVLTTGVDVTGAAGVGDIFIDDIVMQTNGTGLATGTNFTLEKDAGTGLLTFFSEAVASLGANKTEDLQSGSVIATTGPIVLETGQKIVARCTNAHCDGAGTITLWIKARRAADGATLAAAP